jgi:NTE family protein
MALTAAEPRHALVLSGGGGNGAYEVGVARALFDGASPVTRFAPLTPQIYTGTSVGAFNAAYLAQDWASGPQAARALEEVWRRQVADSLASCGNGVYRLRGDPLRWIDPGCAAQPVQNALLTAGDAVHFAFYGLTRGLNLLNRSEPVRVRLAELVDVAAFISNSPFDALLADNISLDRLARSPCELRIVTTDWNAGTSLVLDKTAIVSGLGLPAIKASGAIPGVFPPVMLDGRPFVDGAVRMNTPLMPAITAGADVLHVVYVDPDVADIPEPILPNTLDVFYRIYVIVIAHSMNHDIFTVALVNEFRELAARLLAAGAADVNLDGFPFVQNILRRQRAGYAYRPLTVHRYRPKLPLGGIGGLLDFSAPRIQRLIKQGYEDAIHHDCSANECILPPAPATPATPASARARAGL